MMERVGLNFQCSKKAPVGTLFLLMCVLVPVFALTQEPQRPKCPQGDFPTEDGICCNKCPPGFRLTKNCPAEGHRSKCEACATGLYMDEINYAPNCRICRRCKASKNEVEVSPCEGKKNTVCRCKDGFYQYNIDSETYECRRCLKCGSNERERQMCNPRNNTICVCKENYYRVKNVCELCKNCTPECNHHCTLLPPLNTKGSDSPNNLFTQVVVGAVAVGFAMFVLVAVVTNMVTKRVIKRNLSQSASKQPDDSLTSCEQVLIFSEKPSQTSAVEAIAHHSTGESEGSNLPDCVPLEIKTSDLIYTVLDLVPVLQVKQLVRSLGVTDTEIEQAELDYRPCREAHYQMLRVWAERGCRAGGGGRGGMLHRPLLAELLDKLEKMHLGRASEELEIKYDCQ